ncbi:MAG: 30S ribosomal protein S16 [Gammaproteobacteria bacterium]|nr:30S ribosomal protein S16 [Gammaproteobacteria bacterium]
MVTIRLSRGGSKQRPFYSILVADQRRSTTGRFIERIGFYNPLAKGKEESLRLDTERMNHWIGQGAQPSERVKQLYKQARSQATA